MGQTVDESYKEVFCMEKEQSIGCDVTGCVYDHKGVLCDLDHIGESCRSEDCVGENEGLCASCRGENRHE